MTQHAAAIALWLLSQAGWSPERQIDPTSIFHWYQIHGYTPWPEAQVFLASFGLLTLDATMYGEQHFPPEALAATNVAYALRLRQLHGPGFELHLHPDHIPELAASMDLWATSRLVQERNMAIPLGICRTPETAILRPLFLHRQYGVLLESPGHRGYYPFPIFQSYGGTIVALITTIVRQFLIYEWTADSWPYQ